MKFVSIVAFICLSFIQQLHGAQYFHVNGTKYFVSYPGITKLNWFKAERYCTINGMYLATIHTLEENQIILDIIAKSNATGGVAHFWTSGIDAGHLRHEWYWTPTGYPAVYQNWASGAPTTNSGWNYIFLHSSHEHKWFDNPTSSTFYFICQDRLSLPDTLHSQQCQH